MIASNDRPKLGCISRYSMWLTLQKEVESEPEDFSKWTKLIDEIEQQVAQNTNEISSSHDVKKVIHYDFDRLLGRYPFLSQVWKQYVTIEYTLSGLESSAKVLERAVKAFPQSLDLWLDYININITNKLLPADGIRSLFQKALKLVGRQFMAHPIWDLYIEWEEQNSGHNSNEYLNIYLQIIWIPLYEYARYFEAFTDLRSHFTIRDLIPENTSNTVLSNVLDQLKINGTNWDELDDEKLQTLIDTYFKAIFARTQKGTNERWKYESAITRLQFEPKPVSDEDFKCWADYLDFEEKNGDIEQIICLYERCLITECQYQSVWMRYIRFLIQNTTNEDKVLQCFNNAINRFLLKTDLKIRYMFSKYYELKLHDTEKAENILLEVVKQNPAEYEPVGRIFRLIYRHAKDKDIIIKDALACVMNIHLDMTKKDNISNPRKKRRVDASVTEIKSAKLANLTHILNFKNCSQLVVEVGKIYWLDRHSIKETREVLIKFFNFRIMRSSEPYWLFFVKFEMCEGNTHNLTNIVNYIKFYSEMSITVTNTILSEYNSYMLKNGTTEQISNISRELIRNTLECDMESSTAMKHFLKARLDRDLNEKAVNKRLISENGHPSGVAEARPLISNQIDYELGISELGTAPIPRFSQVERANATVRFAHQDE